MLLVLVVRVVVVVALLLEGGVVVGNSGTNSFFHFLGGRGVLWLLIELLLLDVWLGETENLLQLE